MGNKPIALRISCSDKPLKLPTKRGKLQNFPKEGVNRMGERQNYQRREWRLKEFRQIFERDCRKTENSHPISDTGENLSSTDAEIPSAKYWGIGRRQMLRDGVLETSRRVSQRSLENLRSIPYQDLIRRAFGLPSQGIGLFVWKYELLGIQLYLGCVRAPDNLGQLRVMKEVTCVTDSNIQFCFG